MGLSHQRSSSKQNAVPLRLNTYASDLSGIHGIENEGVIAKLLIVSSLSFIKGWLKGWQIMTDNAIHSFCPIHFSEAWPGLFPFLFFIYFFPFSP